MTVADRWRYDRPHELASDYEVVHEAGVMVPMPDGVHLCTDIYRPARNGIPVPGRHPVVIHRTPYDKNAVESEFGYSRWFARHGYVAVIQDVRGAFGSEGQLAFIGSEGPDGAATLAWIGAQDWAGPVGSWGTSYSSATQLAMASHSPENLKAMVPQQSWVNAWRSSLRHDGALELRWLGWVIWHSATNSRADLRQSPGLAAALNLGAPTTSDWLTRLPIRAGASQLALVPEYEQWFLKVATESDYTEFWQQSGFAPELYFDRYPDADVLLMGGWYDTYSRATLEAYTGLSTRASGRVRLIVGPWVHGTTAAQSSVSGNVEFGSAAAIPDLKDLHLQWFDESLGGSDTGLFAGAPLRIFVMGGGDGSRTPAGHLRHGGHWRDEHEWPLARTEFTAHYLHLDGSLSTEQPRQHNSSTSYDHRPDNPVPTVGGNISALADLLPLPPGTLDTDAAGGVKRTHPIVAGGGFDQTEGPAVFGCSPPYLPLESRQDVLVFRTGILAEDLEVTGPVTAALWVSTSAPDTDFTAKLIDEYPPTTEYPHGYALNITDGIVRLRYRSGSEQSNPVEPGQIERIEITLDPTSNVFAAGHRLRLDISSSNFPKFDANPNTGEPLSAHRRMATATNAVHHDSDHPSHITLPIIPVGQMPAGPSGVTS